MTPELLQQRHLEKHRFRCRVFRCLKNPKESCLERWGCVIPPAFHRGNGATYWTNIPKRTQATICVARAGAKQETHWWWWWWWRSTSEQKPWGISAQLGMGDGKMPIPRPGLARNVWKLLFFQKEITWKAKCPIFKAKVAGFRGKVA